MFILCNFKFLRCYFVIIADNFVFSVVTMYSHQSKTSSRMFLKLSMIHGIGYSLVNSEFINREDVRGVT